MKSLVLLSSGLDSTVSLARAAQETDVKLVICFDYGQRAAIQEIDRADDIAAHYKLDFGVIKLPWFYEITKTALVNNDKPLPKVTAKQIEINDPKLKDAAKAVWVPNRNGVFLSIAAAHAESMDINLVVTGFNVTEAEHFGDNSEDFMVAINESLQHSTLNHVQVGSYVSQLSKTEIMHWAKELDVPIDLVWPCYEGGDEICRTCESCLRFMHALDETEQHDWYTTKTGISLQRKVAAVAEGETADAETAETTEPAKTAETTEPAKTAEAAE